MVRNISYETPTDISPPPYDDNWVENLIESESSTIPNSTPSTVIPIDLSIITNGFYRIINNIKSNIRNFHPQPVVETTTTEQYECIHCDDVNREVCSTLITLRHMLAYHLVAVFFLKLYYDKRAEELSNLM